MLHFTGSEWTFQLLEVSFNYQNETVILAQRDQKVMDLPDCYQESKKEKLPLTKEVCRWRRKIRPFFPPYPIGSSPLHSFIQQLLIACLLCARHCSINQWDYLIIFLLPPFD